MGCIRGFVSNLEFCDIVKCIMCALYHQYPILLQWKLDITQSDIAYTSLCISRYIELLLYYKHALHKHTIEGSVSQNSLLEKVYEVKLYNNFFLTSLVKSDRHYHHLLLNHHKSSFKIRMKCGLIAKNFIFLANADLFYNAV